MKLVTHMAADTNLNSNMLLATKLMNMMLFSKTHRLPWDPGGSELVVCNVRLECAAPRSKLKKRSTSVEASLREQGCLGGFRVVAWGQAAFRGGRNVRELTGCGPDLEGALGRAGSAGSEYKMENTL
jgi:hypothetical protein